MPSEETLQVSPSTDPDALCLQAMRAQGWVVEVVCLRYGISRDRYHDIRQEVTLRLLNFLREGRADERVAETSTFLYRVAQNVVFSTVNSIAGRARLTQQGLSTVTSQVQRPDYPDDGHDRWVPGAVIERTTPELTAMKSERADALHAAAARLSSQQRAIFDGLMQGQTVAEIAEHYGFHPTTAKTHYHRMKAALRQQLQHLQA